MTKKELKQVEAMVRCLGKRGRGCPRDLNTPFGLDCENVCGLDGRHADDSCWKCWMNCFGFGTGKETQGGAVVVLGRQGLCGTVHA